jgi:hypothetical protein
MEGGFALLVGGEGSEGVWEVWRDRRIEMEFCRMIRTVKIRAKSVVCLFFSLFLLLLSTESLTGWAVMDCFSSLRGLLL